MAISINLSFILVFFSFNSIDLSRVSMYSITSFSLPKGNNAQLKQNKFLERPLS